MGEYTSKAQGNLNTVLGAIGAAGAAVNALPNLMGAWAGNRCNMGGCDAPVNRYELDLMMSNAAKDAKIGQLEADKYTDGKLVEIVKDYTAQINNLAAEVRANKDEQNAVNQKQAVFNGGVTSTLGCLESQIQQLFGLTQLKIPNTSVCPGWGDVNITPATTPATA